MSTGQVNPYQSPLTTAASIPVGRPTPARLPLALVVLVACFYHAFVLMLLTSRSPDDQLAGFLFLLNTPTFVIWIVGAARAHSQSFLVGFVASGIQFSINIIMLAAGIGEPILVCMINGLIMLVMILTSGVCQKSGRVQLT